MHTGLPFVQFLLTIAGAVFAALGLALWAIETGADEGLAKTRRRLGKSWQKLSETSWLGVPLCLTGWVVSAMERLIRAFFQDADRGIAFGGVVFFVLFIFIPLAAALNALFGGSPFLFMYYLSLAAALVFLVFSGETGRLSYLNGLVAVYLGASLFLVIPVYVLHSFTDVTINSFFTHSVLKSFLVAVIWYVAAYGIGLMMDIWFRSRGVDPARSGVARFIHQFLAALPVAYVLTFLALLAGHFGVLEQSPLRSWPLVLSSTVLTALSLPTTMLFFGLGVRNRNWLPVWTALTLLAAILFSVLVAMVGYAGTEQSLNLADFKNVLIGLSPDGQGIYLGPQFWILHLPFLPVVGVVVTICSGFLVKSVILGMQKKSGPEAAHKYPFITSALSCAGISEILWFGAFLI